MRETEREKDSLSFLLYLLDLLLLFYYLFLSILSGSDWREYYSKSIIFLYKSYSLFLLYVRVSVN